MKIVSVAEMRALEAAAFTAGTTEDGLQANAARAVAEEAAAHLAIDHARIAVVVGHGNNGRDGALAALHLAEQGVGVDLVLAPRHAVRQEELDRLRELGASISASDNTTAVERILAEAASAIDAIAGIGTHGALREPLAGLVRMLNAQRPRLRVLALDIPSGLDADTGDCPGDVVWADLTVTLGGVKQGLLRGSGAERVGRLIWRDIGIPPRAAADMPFDVLDVEDLRPLLPKRPIDAHKYRFGRVLVVAGSDHFLGAPVLCSGAAARVGAGLITVASSRDVRLNVAAHIPEVTFTAEDVVAGSAGLAALQPYLASHNSVVVGPGLARSAAITSFVHDLLRQRPREHSLVVDADALFALSEIREWWHLVDENVVLTPHSGELARLVGQDLSDAVPLWVHARRLAAQWGCVLVAKGPFTSVAAPDGRVAVWPHANAALATGGTGDVLAGICGGLLAQGLRAFDAARLGVGIHALAGTRIVSERGWRTLLASDLLAEVPAVLAAIGATRR